jgi:hypothetical protein
MSEVIADPNKVWLQDAVRAVKEGGLPNPEAAPGFREGKAEEPNGKEEGRPDESLSFTSSDLTGEDVRVCREFPMPGGKKLYIFPLSQSESRTLAFWSRKINVKIEAEDTPNVRASKIQQIERELSAYQAVLCCYQDEERKKRCFREEDAEKLMQGLRGTRVERIKQISDQLSGEGIDLGFGDLQAFFGRVLECLEGWLSVSATWEDCPVDSVMRTRILISQLRQ